MKILHDLHEKSIKSGRNDLNLNHLYEEVQYIYKYIGKEGSENI